MAYNEQNNQQIKLRHVFFPSIYGFISEIVIAVLALVVFNASWLSSQLISENFGTSNPLLSWPHLIGQTIDGVGHYHIIQQILLFSMWAIVGALIYILAFRLLQMGFGVSHSVGLGMRYFQQDHQRGIFRWLGSLHDFFIKLLVIFIGAGAMAIGAFVCFGIASQELDNGLRESFPNSLEGLAMSLLAAVVSVRIIVFGLTLLLPRFRNWYTV